MTLTNGLDRVFEQLDEARKAGHFYDPGLYEELQVLRSDAPITTRIQQLYAEKRLPPVTGGKPGNCTNCGKPLP